MTGQATPVRVLVIEDASAQRTHLVRTLDHDAGIVVVGQTAASGEAAALVESTKPDAVVLDLHLADGSSRRAIEQIMARTPTPILVLSTRIDDRRSPSAVDALVAGACEALPRPDQWTPELADGLRRAVRQISAVAVVRHPRGLSRTSAPAPTRPRTRTPVVAVAASTGGPSALATLLAGLTGLAAPVLVVQHLHPDFTTGLVDWMARVSGLPVELAQHGRAVRAGRVYVAPGEVHLRLGQHGRLVLDPEPATIHRPSADQLFRSVAEHAEGAAVGVLLTGMGDDGARGLLEIRRAGGHTLAQDEASSAVFGMPKAARRLGAVDQLHPLAELPKAIRHAVREVLDGH